jgi:hypothetical protein
MKTPLKSLIGPYAFIGFGSMDVTKPYEFIGFGAMDVTKPYEFIELFIRFEAMGEGACFYLPSLRKGHQIMICVCFFGWFPAVLGPETRSNGSGSRNGAERTPN